MSRRHEVRHARMGLTVLELLVVFAIVSALLGLVLPAVQAARETARRTECASHLRQIGIALHRFHDAQGGLPPGWHLDPSGKTAFGWATSLLPHLELGDIAAKINFRERADSAGNAIGQGKTLALFRCPSDVFQDSFALYEENESHEEGAASSTDILMRLPAANYVGVFGTTDPDDVPGKTGDGAFLLERSIRFVEFRRGLSRTLLVGERTAQKLPSTWFGFAVHAEDATGRVVGYADKGPNRNDADECEFDSRHPGHTNFLWADGHVSTISDTIDSKTYRNLARRDLAR